MLLLVLALTQAPIELTPGMVITQSVRVVPKVYRLSGAPIVVRGDNITVDFRGATVEGSSADTAIRVDGGSNVRIVNAHVRGYKVGILAARHRSSLPRDERSEPQLEAAPLEPR